MYRKYGRLRKDFFAETGLICERVKSLLRDLSSALGRYCKKCICTERSSTVTYDLLFLVLDIYACMQAFGERGSYIHTPYFYSVNLVVTFNYYSSETPTNGRHHPHRDKPFPVSF